MTKVVYPGSFDPITLGHVDLIERLTQVFDVVTSLVAQSSRKESLFTAPERIDLIHKCIPHLKNVKVESYSGLTVDFMKANQIHIIARGLRTVSDYEYEIAMAQMNKKLYPSCETFFLQSAAHLNFISSSGIKEIAINKGSIQGFIPDVIIPLVIQKIERLKL